MHIGMLTDYVAVDFANGPALATQTFKRNMEMRGHKVTLVGPRPGKNQRQPPPDSLLFDSAPFHQYDKVRFGFPTPASTYLDRPPFDVVHAHTNALTMHWPALVRKLHGIPVVQTNTVYLPGFAHHAIPEEALNFGPTKPLFDKLTRGVENVFGGAFNEGDGLIVQCQGLVDYWRNRGLSVPIHIIQRPIDVRNFNRELGPDPFQRDFERGDRLFVACRHAGEKSLDQLLAVFAHHILPKRPEASLTLVGDGPAHASLVQLADTLGIAHRTQFVGERPQRDLPEWYANADLFVYTSMTETFGQVVSESLWMGTPVVGFDDGMGVAHQVKHEKNGLLVQKGPGENEAFAAAILRLLDDPAQRQAFGLEAARQQRLTSGPEVVYKAYEDAYEAAREHLAQNPPPAMSWRNLRDRVELTRRHLMPWWTLHGLLVTLGAVPTSYRARSEVPFDAAPVNPADESYAHRGGKTPLPTAPEPGAATHDDADRGDGAAELARPERKRRASSTARRPRRTGGA
ncbi:MAG: hypothetical protein RIT45_3582 [Pseudomonadota bacterium]